MTRLPARTCDRCMETKGDVHAMLATDGTEAVVFLCLSCRTELPSTRYKDLSLTTDEKGKRLR